MYRENVDIEQRIVSASNCLKLQPRNWVSREPADSSSFVQGLRQRGVRPLSARNAFVLPEELPTDMMRMRLGEFWIMVDSRVIIKREDVCKKCVRKNYLSKNRK